MKLNLAEGVFSEKELFSYKTKLIQPWPVVQEKAIATARSCL
ncbi:hypothetical protein [Pseudomonas chlororaphis]|jgi:hypothetical protein|nr:hypothetical protein [Pseudomonas chlororaphis]WDG51711.1 hypothetical protein PUP76_17640 [Pseudomonas chlororaphis]WDH87272.1 hypothetical protein PUP74_24545 [Pseudomonas chlororaphis]